CLKPSLKAPCDHIGVVGRRCSDDEISDVTEPFDIGAICTLHGESPSEFQHKQSRWKNVMNDLAELHVVTGGFKERCEQVHCSCSSKVCDGDALTVTNRNKSSLLKATNRFTQSVAVRAVGSRKFTLTREPFSRT